MVSPKKEIKKNKKPVYNKATRSKIVEAEFYLFVLGFQQKEVAERINVTKQTLWNWGKQYNWPQRLKKKYEDMQANPTKFDDSLSAFKAYVRVKHDNSYLQIESIIKEYLKAI